MMMDSRDVRQSTARSRQQEESLEASREVLEWASDFLMSSHPDLGRKGAVCPFMDQAAKAGRVSYTQVRIEERADFARLRMVAEDGLTRIHGAGGPGGTYESMVFVPVGGDRELLTESVIEVQQELADSALARGCMIGDFYPRHPMPGVHNPDFRPLASPRPILGIRTMVDTDILFLAHRSVPPDRIEANISSWYRFFGDVAAPGLIDFYERVRRTAASR
jgi:hypothetical protein